MLLGLGVAECMSYSFNPRGLTFDSVSTIDIMALRMFALYRRDSRVKRLLLLILGIVCVDFCSKSLLRISYSLHERSSFLVVSSQELYTKGITYVRGYTVLKT